MSPLPVPADFPPEPDRRDAEARVWLWVPVVLVPPHGNEMVFGELVPGERDEVGNRKGVPIDEYEKVARIVRRELDHVGEKVQLDRMARDLLRRSVVELRH